MEEKRPKLKTVLTGRTPAQRQAAERRRLDPAMRMLKAFHSVTAPEGMTAEELEKQRKGQELLGNLAAPMAGMDWETFSLGGMPAAWMRLERPHRRRHAVLYCHGGGYTSGNLGYSKVLASKLTQVTGYDVLTFEYRLAPEHPYPAAVEDAVRAWDYLMHLGYGARDVVVAGDSAGGNLALVLCHRLRARNRMLPAALLLMSPWTDMTASGPSYEERAEIDPMLTNAYISAVREAYAPGRDLHSPELSPLFGDFLGFPPTLIQVGTHEILYSDAERLRDAMREARVPCRLEVWEDMWHVFQMFPTKKAASAMEEMGRFLLELL
jgi:monoterpene epsilon-lactone hydrolase